MAVAKGSVWVCFSLLLSEVHLLCALKPTVMDRDEVCQISLPMPLESSQCKENQAREREREGDTKSGFSIECSLEPMGNKERRSAFYVDTRINVVVE